MRIPKNGAFGARGAFGAIALCVFVVVACALMGADIQRVLSQWPSAVGPIREGVMGNAPPDAPAAAADAPAAAPGSQTTQVTAEEKEGEDEENLKTHYYLALKDREAARVDNMTSRQAYDDLNTSYSLQLAHIGIMFFFALCVLFTLLNLDVFEGLFGGGAPGGVVDTTVYAAKKSAK